MNDMPLDLLQSVSQPPLTRPPAGLASGPGPSHGRPRPELAIRPSPDLLPPPAPDHLCSKPSLLCQLTCAANL
eukprot:scaffold56666_cov57-Phaeocystis_antarctica.AAC.5